MKRPPSCSERVININTLFLQIVYGLYSCIVGGKRVPFSYVFDWQKSVGVKM